MMKILSVNVSEAKGTVKTARESITLDKSGVCGDAHAGPWHRQVSLLGEAAYRMMELDPEEFPFGSFAENITTEGSPGEGTPDLKSCRPGDRFSCGDVLLEVTQIGKQCHGPGCAIYEKSGRCIMPKEGIFTRVLSGGILKPGDNLIYNPKKYHIAVITVSTRAFNGFYTDSSGPALKDLVAGFCSENDWPCEITGVLLPDDPAKLHNELRKFIRAGYDMVFTTGGTGLGPSDITIGIVRRILQREIPGIMEYIRISCGKENPNALLSASLAGVSENTLVFALPGSVNAVKEYFSGISRCLKHMVYMRMGLDVH
ncbi:MAG: molybdenum cofactor synthesis protein [Bacteroidales bacterium]|jgi:molybdenum cofactor synthesis domain-containing protein|nr:molybdenum cofactor synthesis protein [Bacteroidales bacterium]